MSAINELQTYVLALEKDLLKVSKDIVAILQKISTIENDMIILKKAKLLVEEQAVNGVRHFISYLQNEKGEKLLI